MSTSPLVPVVEPISYVAVLPKRPSSPDLIQRRIAEETQKFLNDFVLLPTEAQSLDQMMEDFVLIHPPPFLVGSLKMFGCSSFYNSPVS